MMNFFSSLLRTTTGRRPAPALLARWAVALLLLLAAPLLGRAQAPTISGFSPASGVSGTSVVITGTNFTSAQEVRFNGTAAPGFVVNSATQLTVNVPAGATTGPIRVDNNFSNANSAASFVTDNYIIGSGPLTVCSGNFYDNGGPNGVISYGYGGQLDAQTTFSPATAGAKVRLNFSQFEMDQFYDFLEIYDGPSTNSRLLGKYAGISSPGQVTATNSTGQLTVRLYSISYTASYGRDTYAGFAASIGCVSGVPTINSFTPAFGAPGTSVVLTGTDLAGVTGVAFNGTAAPGFVVNSGTQITVPVPAGATSGYISVTYGGSSSYSTTIFTTDNTLIGIPAITACSGTIYDAANNYSGSGLSYHQTRTTAISPTSVGAKTRLTFTQFTLSTTYNPGWGYDFLRIYDGPDTNSPVLGEYNGFTGSPGTVTATNPTGQLTLLLNRTLPQAVYPPIVPAFSATISCLLGVPNITSFAPTSGVAGTSVVLTGFNFSGITAVAFNGVAAPGFVVNSPTQITVPVPAGNATGLITVTNGIGTGRSVTGFTVSPPTISGFTPATGPAGTAVVLTGTNFTGTTAVVFNGVAAAGFVVNSNTQLTATVPVGAATGPISVTTAGGIATSTASFTALTPGISGFTPGSGFVGTSVVVTGTDFTGTTSVRFNGTNAPGFVVNSNTQLTVPVPAGATSGLISLTTPSGTATSAASFLLVPPAISSFTPTSGVAGTSVVITGTYFTGATAVAFNGTPAPGFVVNSNTQITVSVPVGATTGPISLTNASGTGSSTTPFTLPPPTVSGFSPANGIVGTSVTITGTSFSQVSAVRFNGVAASGFTVNSSTQITVSVPSGVTTGPITVTTPSGTGTSAASFIVRFPIISSFSPTSGATNTSVVLTGANFTGATAVRLNGQQLYTGFTVNSDTQITLYVPYGATSGLFAVTTPTGTGTSATAFTVPPPTISGFSPTSGVAGTSVVITGTNFSFATAVRFNGLYAPSFTVNSSTQITVPVPTGATTGPISVTQGATATSAASFVTTNYWMAPAAITACSGILYDAFGAATLEPGPGQTTTLSPATAGAKVQLSFFEFDLGNPGPGEGLYLYDGPDATAPLIGRYTTASPGTVTATNATGQLTVRLGFNSNYVPGFAATISCVTGLPTISSFAPASAGLGAPVVLTGANFTGTTAVRFNGLLAPGFVVNSPTQVTVNVPAAATAGRITVTNAVGLGTSTNSFTPLAPAISSFTPATGVTGASVVVTGAYFTGASAVRFNGVAASFVVNSSTQITTTVPAGASYGPISVTNSLGTGTSSANFGTEINIIGAAANITTCLGSIYDSGGPNGDYGNNENLTTTISPGTPGAKVRLSFSGVNIRGGSDALRVYDGADASAPLIGYLAAFQSGSTPVVTATNATGQLTLVFTSISTNYTLAGFAAAISCVNTTLSSFTPTSGAAGTSVVITGTEFTNTSAVRFNGVLAAGFVVNSDTQITVPVPAGNASGLVSVTAPFGTATSTASFTVPAPTLTAVSPFIGVPGSVVTLTGTNLTGTSSITFFGSAGQRIVSTGFGVNAAGTQLTGVVVPAGAQSGPITVTTGGGTTPVGAALFSRASIVAAGGSHTVAVRPDGSLWAWGNNASGQLGLGTTGGQQPSPVRVGTGNAWVSAAAGGGHTLAIRADGTLWAWGNNDNGQLGLGSLVNQNTPQQVGTATSWANVAAGTSHTVAVRANGTLWTWGDNANGQLGIGSLTDKNVPEQIGTNWASAAAGGGHTVAVRADGTLWAWGLNGNGQLGLGTTVNQTTPQRVGSGISWASAAAGATHTVAVQADGSLWAWGNNGNGQLGLGSTTSYSSPQLVGSGLNWMSVAAGSAHTVAVRPDGSLWTWGSNAIGQLGLGTTTDQTTPQFLGALTNWTSAAAGASHSAGEQSCGAFWAWGLNATGQVGDGSTTQRLSPVLIFNPISLLTFSPTTAGAGSPVTVTGTNLAGLTALTVNGANALASVTNSTATGFSFVVPASAPQGAGTVSVAAGCGTGSSPAFTVGPPTPILNTLNRAAELPGQAVVLTGLNFTSGSTVSFGGVAAASVTFTSTTSLTAVVPVGATPGPSAVVVSTATGSSPNSPAFEVLQVYRGTAASGCLPTATASLTGSGGAGTWRYLRLPGAGGAVVAAIEDTNNLGTVAASFTALGTATGASVRDDGSRAYLDRNFTLTATTKTFTGSAVRVRFFGLSSELARLAAVDVNATLAGLKASQYSGFNENCTLVDNDPAGERRLLAAPATALAGADWFTAEVSVADHFSEFYLTGAATPLLAPTQAPLLTAVSPARNLPTAPLGANVALTFSQPMSPATAGNVRVFGSQRSGQLVRGGNATASGNTITVNPARGFAPGERVFVTVPGTVQGTNGYNTVPKVHEFTAETAQATATFLAPPMSYVMGGLSVNIAVGDLNGDGRLDVVTSDFFGDPNINYNNPGVVVRFGLGNGQLGPSSTYPAFTPGAITLGDVDGDGDLDIVVVSTDSGNMTTGYLVTTRLNNGSGDFSVTYRLTQVATSPTHAVLGDLDGDGDLDMLTAASTATVSFNDGSGNFTDNGGGIPTGGVAADVAVGDVDGDGDLDALVANGSTVSVRLNDGSGAFSGTYDVPMGAPITKLAVGDLDGDGDLDLATSSSATSTLSVRLNNGDGTFGGGASYAVPFVPQTLALGDVDGDGDLDLATAGQANGGFLPGQAGLRLNNGNGTFGGGSDFATGADRAQLALGDLDGDGTLDLLTSHIGHYIGTTGGIPTFANNALFIRLNTALPPTLAGFSPLSGPAGTLVTITGTNLNAVRGVRFGGSSALALLTAQSATSLTVQVPVGAATGVLTLTTLRGLALSTATAFTYTPRPAGLLATLSPAGPLEVCAPLTLTGTATSPAFTTGAGLSNATGPTANVNGIVVRPNGKVLVAGGFVSYNGSLVPANRIVQLNPDGTRDAAFLTGGGFNGAVNAVALQADGKVLVGGDFTDYNGTLATRLIRLNPDGSPDATFATGSGFDALVQSIVVQPDGQVVVGGAFTSYNVASGLGGIIRLNPDGSRDPSFATGTGFNSGVLSLALQADGKVLVGGAGFTSYNGAAQNSSNNIARLNADGSYDASFVMGTGFNARVQSLAVQADGKVLASGTFDIYNGATGLNGIIRLHNNTLNIADGTRDNGFVTGSGFTDINNLFVAVNVVALQPDGNILVGGQFVKYKGSTQNRLARLDTYGTLDATFNIGTGTSSGFDVGVRRLAVQPDGSVVAGGGFTLYQGVAAGHLIRLLPNGSANTAPTPVSGATFTFAPGNTTANPLVTSTLGTYSVVASLNGETSAVSNSVTLTPCTARPTVTALSALAELPGMPITLTGTGFTAGSTVRFGGVASGSVTVNSLTSLTATVPAGAVAGTSPIVVTTTVGGSSLSAPAFQVLAVYDGGALDACTATVPPTASLNDGAWHYLLSSSGQVVAAYNYTGASLGNLALDVLRANPAAPVRQEAGMGFYLDRNFHLTNSSGRFDGRTVALRLYGLTTEFDRLKTATPALTLATLKATQYSGANEDCDLANNAPAGERRTLPAPAASLAGAPWFAAEMSVADHFSEFYLIGASTPLPVELLSFTATTRATAVALAWRTASEKNSDRFEVERSRDGRTFERIGQVAGAGSSSAPRNYELLDESLPAGAATLYYRLKQVDADATFSYSPVRTITLMGATAGMTLFPNPIHGGRSATLMGAAAGTPVRVYDAVGREVLSATVDATGQAALRLPPGLAQGVYVVRVGAKALRLTIDD